jgi:hypothetical protein
LLLWCTHALLSFRAFFRFPSLFRWSGAKMPCDAMSRDDDMSCSRELQAKYEFVLAENEQLSHDLRTEEAQRQRFESAYRQVQEDVQKGQATLRQLYAQIEANTGDLRASNTPDDEKTSHRGRDDSRVGSSRASVALAADDDDRVRRLERDCAYLRAKVESLHLALRHYEVRDPATEVGGVGVAWHTPNPTRRAAQAKERDALSCDPAAAASAVSALETERERRRRAEEQLIRCHATLQSLRDDAAQKEFFFHQQLSALQEQNAALLEDLDTWVTREQQVYLANTFASRHDAVAEDTRATPASSCTPPVAVFHGDVEGGVPTGEGTHESAQLQQMQQYLKDQEAVLALKNRSIEQLETRVAELEGRLANAEMQRDRLRDSSPPPATATNPMKQLMELRREAAVVDSAVRRFAHQHLPTVYIPRVSPLQRQRYDEEAEEGASADVAVNDVQRVLRLVLEVLSKEAQSSESAAEEHRKPATTLRAPPITVVQPAVESDTYHSGETLSEAAQQLAQLMRRHVRR